MKFAGLVLSWDYTTPDTFVAIGKLISISFPTLSRTAIDSTNTASTLHEYVAGLLDAGTLSFTVNYEADDAEHVDLVAAAKAGTTHKFKIACTDTGAAEWGFSGFMLSFAPEAGGPDTLVTAAVEVQLSTTVTVTP